jgi:hybrid cluster-associated redox disulfide protein
MRVTPETLVDDVLRESPRTFKTFVKWGMKCPGCPIGIFHTVRDACSEHGADLVLFLADLWEVDAKLDHEVHFAADCAKA